MTRTWRLAGAVCWPVGVRWIVKPSLLVAALETGHDNRGDAVVWDAGCVLSPMDILLM